MTSQNTGNLRLEAALGYARGGWPVLPLHAPTTSGCCSCSRKATCTHIGKHPRTRQGCKDATTDESTIRRWWKKWPDANIGIATGGSSGVLVLDVDNKTGRQGDASLDQLCTQYHWQPAATYTVRTGCGKHLYFTVPHGCTVKNRADILDGIDLRGDGGYVVAPPSIHATGTVYSLSNPAAPEVAPDWLVALANGATAGSFSEHPAKRERALTAPEMVALSSRGELLPTQADAPWLEGNRNTNLTSIGGLLRWAGQRRQSIEALLLLVNEQHCVPPLDPAEVARIAASTNKYPPARDRLGMYWYRRSPEQQNSPEIRVLTDFERGWLVWLQDAAWVNAGVLPSSLDDLSILAQATNGDMFHSHSGRVLELFRRLTLCDGDVLVDERLALEYLHSIGVTKLKSEAGKASGACRKRQSRSPRQRDRHNTAQK